MAQVSIGQVENLSHAIWAIEICAQEAEMETSLRIAEVKRKLNETEEFLNTSRQLVQEKESAFATAKALLVAAQIALATAEAVLASVREDEDSFGAEAAVAAARAALVVAELNREKAVRDLDLARQRAEIVQGNYSRTQSLHERVIIECSSRAKIINAISTEGKNRLERALAALEAYLNSNADAKAVYGYVKPVVHQTFQNRLSLNSAQQKILVQYFAETDPAFRNKIAGYRSALRAAGGQAERDAVLAQATKDLGSECAEKMADLALHPLGDDVQAQIAYTLKDEEKTFIDLIISNLKAPVILEEGEEATAPQGGSIAIEIKTGRKKLLNSLEEYREQRAKENPDTSIVLCIRNIKDLSPDEAAELRAALNAADSPILAMLPDNDLIDEALWKIIVGEDENAES